MNFKSVKLSPHTLFFAVLSVLCMIIIFCFSMENSDESSKTSGKLTEAAVEIIVDDYEALPHNEQAELADIIEHIIRKLAHFSLYTVLGFLVSCTAGKRKLFSKASAIVLAICFIYACSDELHQFFVPGRACQFTDVLIDSTGALTGILISMAAFLAIKIFSKNNHESIKHKKPVD